MTSSRRWVELQSARGYTFRVWREVDVPEINQRYLDCSIYLYASRQSAEDGDDAGGSGCLVSVQDEHWGARRIVRDKRLHSERFERDFIWTPPHLYAVTNKHVIRKGFPVIRLNTVDGTADVLELQADDWIEHPEGDDLAVAAIELPPIHEHAYYPVFDNQFIDRDSLTRTVGAGDDVFMVGRFVNHAGKQRNTPSLRFGSIAMLPFEKVKLADGHMQEAFLVEVRSISGYSGSPVFVYKPKKERIRDPNERAFDLTSSNWGRSRSRQETITELVGIPELLGIDCGHIPKREKVVNGAGTPHPQGWRVDTNTGMAVVIPAWRLYDLLNKPELVMQRKEKDEKHLKEKESESTVVADTESVDTTLTQASYEDALRRASSRVSEPESENKTKRKR